jgi:hypothetical protein
MPVDADAVSSPAKLEVCAFVCNSKATLVVTRED